MGVLDLVDVLGRDDLATGEADETLDEGLGATEALEGGLLAAGLLLAGLTGALGHGLDGEAHTLATLDHAGAHHGLWIIRTYY